MIKLTEEELETVKTILRKHASTYDVYIFGSRKNGNSHRHSDLDIAIKGSKRIDLLLLAEMRDDFQESNLPFRVDLIDFYRVSPEFQKIILNEGIVLDV